jgi:hypothetical protein
MSTQAEGEEMELQDRHGNAITEETLKLRRDVVPRSEDMQ